MAIKINIYALYKTQFRPKNTQRLKAKGWEKSSPCKCNQKKNGVAILLSDKIDFKTKTVTRDHKGIKLTSRGQYMKKI